MLADPPHLSQHQRTPSPPPLSSSCSSYRNPKLKTSNPCNHRNQQYSIIGLTNAAGMLVERYSYTAYGTLGIYDASGTVRTTSTYANRYTYTGREYDADLNLYHFRARWYDPSTGGFISRDPLAYVDGMSLYRGYFGVGGADPSGLLLLDDQWHHVLAWKWIHYFRLAGYDINDPAFGVMIPELQHRKINKECEAFWDELFESHRKNKTIPTREQIEAHLNSDAGKALDKKMVSDEVGGYAATERYKGCNGRRLSVPTCLFHDLTYSEKPGIDKLPKCTVAHLPGQRMKCPIVAICAGGATAGVGGTAIAGSGKLAAIGGLIDRLNDGCAMVEFVNESSTCKAAREEALNVLNNRLRVSGGEENCRYFLEKVAAWRGACGFDFEKAAILRTYIVTCEGFPTLPPRPGVPRTGNGPGGATATVDE